MAIDDGALVQHHLDVAHNIRAATRVGARDWMMRQLQSFRKSRG